MVRDRNQSMVKLNINFKCANVCLKKFWAFFVYFDTCMVQICQQTDLYNWAIMGIIDPGPVMHRLLIIGCVLAYQLGIGSISEARMYTHPTLVERKDTIYIWKPIWGNSIEFDVDIGCLPLTGSHLSYVFS